MVGVGSSIEAVVIFSSVEGGVERLEVAEFFGLHVRGEADIDDPVPKAAGTLLESL